MDDWGGASLPWLHSAPADHCSLDGIQVAAHTACPPAVPRSWIFVVQPRTWLGASEWAPGYVSVTCHYHHCQRQGPHHILLSDRRQSFVGHLQGQGGRGPPGGPAPSRLCPSDFLRPWGHVWAAPPFSREVLGTDMVSLMRFLRCGQSTCCGQDGQSGPPHAPAVPGPPLREAKRVSSAPHPREGSERSGPFLRLLQPLPQRERLLGVVLLGGFITPPHRLSLRSRLAGPFASLALCLGGVAEWRPTLATCPVF